MEILDKIFNIFIMIIGIFWGLLLLLVIIDDIIVRWKREKRSLTTKFFDTIEEIKMSFKNFGR